MACIVVDGIYKSYENFEAVKGVSFRVEDQEIFGLLGPNGAGKSSIIKMLLDFIKPDNGTITVLNAPFNEKTKGEIGYLPEERGLYDNISVIDNLCYLAMLKGANPKEAKGTGLALLKRVGLEEQANAKVNALSKGQKQLVQLCVTLAHNPKLLILDEPFSGLDPTNRELVKHIMLEERAKGKTIVLSTHMMNEVEELCDRALMISNGRRVLYGRIQEIKASYASNCVFVEFEGVLPHLDGIEKADIKNNCAEFYLRVDVTPQYILRQLVSANTQIRRFDIKELSLNDIFIKVAEAEQWIRQ
ncbi:MAG: ATP-binding cassette domain-containing protein [archaeon]